MPDAEIAAAIVAGDPAALATFDHKYRRLFEFLARRANVPAEDARDIAQTTLSMAVVQIQRGLFRGESSLGAWLNPILRARIADYWRTTRRSPQAAPPSGALGAANGPDLAALAGPVDHDLVLQVRSVVAALPPLHRTVLVLNQHWGFTTQEIAVRLRRPAGTVGRILAEAKEKFRTDIAVEESGRRKRLETGEAL